MPLRVLLLIRVVVVLTKKWRADFRVVPGLEALYSTYSAHCTVRSQYRNARFFRMNYDVMDHPAYICRRIELRAERG
jgi:hypothetical protein